MHQLLSSLLVNAEFDKCIQSNAYFKACALRNGCANVSACLSNTPVMFTACNEALVKKSCDTWTCCPECAAEGALVVNCYAIAVSCNVFSCQEEGYGVGTDDGVDDTVDFFGTINGTGNATNSTSTDGTVMRTMRTMRIMRITLTMLMMLTMLSMQRLMVLIMLMMQRLVVPMILTTLPMMLMIMEMLSMILVMVLIIPRMVRVLAWMGRWPAARKLFP